MKRTGHSFAGGRQVIARGMLRARSVVLILAVIGISTVALATPPFKVLFNIILSKGTASATLSEHVQVASTPVAGAHEGEEQGDYDDGNDWKLELETEGATDFYIQDLAIAPGGYSGWHTHPGIFIGTVISGTIDFYNANCVKRTFTAGQVVSGSQRPFTLSYVAPYCCP